jgi:hypothetical protein
MAGLPASSENRTHAYVSEPTINKRIERLCAHSILVCAVLLATGIFGIAGWLPPVRADMNAQSLVELFQRDRLRIQLGMTVMGSSAMFYWFFAAAVSTQLQRIEGQYHPLSRIQMISAAGTALAIMFLTFLALAMCFRPNIEPTALQMANDLFWLIFVGLWMPGVSQNLAIGVGILSDKRLDAERIYPRWVAYVNFWVALSFVPGCYIAFFHQGPFSWHGILGLWLVATGFFLWVVVMWWSTVRAIEQA